MTFFQKIETPQTTLWIATSNDQDQPQSQAVRHLLKKLLQKLKINDQLCEQEFPYRLEKTGYFVCFSHSGNTCAVIICKTHSVGIDIENRNVSWKIVQRYYHQNEIKQLSQLSTNQKQLISKQLWQIKECFIKINQDNLMAGMKQDFSKIISILLKNNHQNQFIINITNILKIENINYIFINNLQKIVAVY